MRGTIDTTLDHVFFLSRRMDGCNLSCMILFILLELNIPSNCLGFDYLYNAILEFCRGPVQTLAKGIYPAVARHYDSGVKNDQMEQAIRSAIKKAWENRDDVAWKYYFSQDEYGNVKKPTNSEFITRIGRVIQLWQGCCKEVTGYDNEQ